MSIITRFSIICTQQLSQFVYLICRLLRVFCIQFSTKNLLDNFSKRSIICNCFKNKQKKQRSGHGFLSSVFFQRAGGWCEFSRYLRELSPVSFSDETDSLVRNGFSPLQEKRFVTDYQTGVSADENCLWQIHKVHVQA